MNRPVVHTTAAPHRRHALVPYHAVAVPAVVVHVDEDAWAFFRGDTFCGALVRIFAVLCFFAGLL